MEEEFNEIHVLRIASSSFDRFVLLTFSILLRCNAYLSCARNCINLIFELCDNSVMLLMLGKNLRNRATSKTKNQMHAIECATKVGEMTNLNIFWTATIVLQSERLSSSAEFDCSLLTTTTFSANVIPPRSKSSRRSIEPCIQYTNGKYEIASRNATCGRWSNSNMMGFNDVFDLKWARNGMIKL